MINEEAILKKTHYGSSIYAFILKEAFPEDQVVMKISGRDCGICRNPFQSGSLTLHVFINKLNPDVLLSDEIAEHHDLSGTIQDGNAIDFASLYYGKSGHELLEHINKQMNLHLEDGYNFYNKQGYITEGPRFSFFRAPITNILPAKNLTIKETFMYITGYGAAERTLKLRSITDPKKARIYKAANFDYCTFCGKFSSRKDETIKTPSGLICLDFDHIIDVEDLFVSLLKDDCFETQLLFRSPSGNGLKWVIPIEKSSLSHSDYFRALSNYISTTYGVEIDQSGKDLSRACFLPHDSKAYINPKYQ